MTHQIRSSKELTPIVSFASGHPSFVLNLSWVATFEEDLRGEGRVAYQPTPPRLPPQSKAHFRSDARRQRLSVATAVPAVRARTPTRGQGDRASRVSGVMTPSKRVKKTRQDARKDPAAAHQLAEWYALGQEGLSRDLSLWLRWETEAAERGCVDAQAALFAAYHNGDRGLQVNLKVSIEWCRKAALQARPGSQRQHFQYGPCA